MNPGIEPRISAVSAYSGTVPASSVGSPRLSNEDQTQGLFLGQPRSIKTVHSPGIKVSTILVPNLSINQLMPPRTQMQIPRLSESNSDGWDSPNTNPSSNINYFKGEPLKSNVFFLLVAVQFTVKIKTDSCSNKACGSASLLHYIAEPQVEIPHSYDSGKSIYSMTIVNFAVATLLLLTREKDWDFEFATSQFIIQVFGLDRVSINVS